MAGPRAIFVFGSNKAGRHGKGAALYARQNYGAVYGVGRGRTGDAYAIPTKSETLQTLGLGNIRLHVREFLLYANERRDLNFLVTAIGTGLAGYSHKDIAPLFDGAPRNCSMPVEWAGLFRWQDGKVAHADELRS
jgi:hypothetical protein